MKIAHIADIHWGLNYPGPNPEARFEDICIAANFTAERIIAEGCEMVLFAGDAFKDARVFLDRASVEIKAFVTWLRKLTQAGIQVVAISGTPSHDSIAAYELIQEMRIPGVTICTSPQIVTHKKIDIVCVPGMDRTNIANRDEFKNMNVSEMHQFMTQKITQMVMGLTAQTHNYSILLEHITCVGSDKGFEDMLMQQEAVLTREAIESSRLDLVCLGHIHKPQRIEGLNVPAYYSGSIERLSFNDEGIQTGFWIHELEETEDDYQFDSKYIETPSRDYVTLDVQIKDYEGAQAFLESLKTPGVSCPDYTDSVVRVRYKVDEEVAKVVNSNAIKKALIEGGAYYVQEIKPEIERTAKIRAKIDAEMSTIEALEQWMKLNGIPEKDWEDLKSRALEIERAVSVQ